MKKSILTCMLLSASAAVSGQSYVHTVTAEALDRGVVALPADKGAFVSWRSLTTDADHMTFDVYRDGTKVNNTPLTVTNFIDETAGSQYEVRCIVDGNVVDSQIVTALELPYMRVHLDRPEGGTSPAGGKDEMRDYTYTPDDVSVGDVDGNGQYELFVKWHPTNQADNSFSRYTGNTYIDCYRLDGTKLWRIDLGINIRSGNHYTQFMVYDFDGDGKAEMICKTAPGTVDGVGHNVVMGDDDPTADYRNSSGIILSGPEYLTVFNGLTGAEINTITYNPSRNIHAHTKAEWGDNYGNRCERYLACVAYLDGEKPSAVFCRGYYTYSYLWAVDFDGEKLTERWLHVSDTKGVGAYGEGAHAITVGDVDADGNDEIVYGAACIDHDGTLLYRTGAGHGDALHLAAMLPDRNGLQVFMPHEEKGAAYLWDAELRDAATGEILFGNPQSGQDNGRGLAANISSNWSGYEYWSSKHRNPQNHGEDVGNKSLSINFRVYWDGDLLDELLDGTSITKPNNAITSVSTLMDLAKYSNATSCNDTKKTPNLQADIFGDWREEIILHDKSTESDLLIFTTTIPTDYKVNCLMQDRQYREAVAWQNVAYNQPPHLGYNLEEAFNTSAAFYINEGAANQVVNVGEDMQPIVFEVRRADAISIVEKPDWMAISYDEATHIGKITGAPDDEGDYLYCIETVGSESGAEARLEGKIVGYMTPAMIPMAYFDFEQVGTEVKNEVFGAAQAVDGVGTSVEGVIGNALHLDGKTYYVQQPYGNLNFGSNSFTIEFWARSEDTAAYILQQGSTAANSSTGATGNWVGVEVKNGQLKFAIDDDVTKSGIDVAGASKWFDGNWHYFVFVRDVYAKSLYVYVDGVKVGESTDMTGTLNCQNEALVIGNVNVSFNNTFSGDIDQLNIGCGVMTPAQIEKVYEAVTSGNGISDIVADTALYTVVDAFTGLIVKEGYAKSPCDVVDGIDKGIYIIVKQQGNSYETFKFIKR